jgi:protein TonB
MAKELRSDNPEPQNIQFAHFGILDDGKQSKGAFTTAIVTNLIIAALIIIIGSAVKTVVTVAKAKDVAFTPVKEPPPKPPPPPPPPPRLPPPPPPKVLDQPKIKIPPPIEKPPDPKPVEVKMPPQPVHMTPAPPKAVTPPPAPKAVSLAANIAPASVRNNDAHPSAVRLGQTENPLKPLTGPAVAPVNFGVAGHPGMPASNTGSGPNSAKTVSGFGCPTCTNLSGKDAGSRQVVGVKLTTGGNGPLNSKNLTGAPVNVHLQTQAPPPAATAMAIRTATIAAPPKVISKPTPVYTEEAKQMHLEGNVSIQIKITSTGAVQVVRITHGLGHGLDESARRAIEGTRFSPALDTTGHPIDWEGVVNVSFQMAG